MRLATWNVNSVSSRLPRLVEWLTDVAPDVICLQETKCAGDAFPRPQIAALGYEIAAHGDGRWNGVAVLSRVGLAEISFGFPGQPGFAAGGEAGPALLPTEPVVEARALGATCGPLRVWSVYVPNGRSLDSPHYPYKLAWLEAFRDALAGETAGHQALAVCGDFNVAPTDSDVWDPAAFVGSTHVTPAERSAVAALGELGLRDVVPRALKYDRPYTYWDYRAGMFHKNLGMRIDLVYLSSALAVLDAYVDREARKGKGPSDHAPIVVDIDV
ncbi:MAG: exodeoxyribonuclease III [Mycobacteriales bacterium]